MDGRLVRGAASVVVAAVAVSGQQAVADVAWDSEQVLSAPAQSAAGVRSASSRDGRTVVAVWVSRDATGGQVQARTLLGGRWGPVMPLSGRLPSVAAPQVDISGDGALAVAVWQQGPPGASTISAAQLTAGQWSQARSLSAGDARNARVAVAGDGTGAVAVWDRSDGSAWRVEAARRTATGWTAAVPLSGQMAAAGLPDVDAAAASGSVMAVWQHERSGAGGPQTSIESSISTGSEWSAPTTVGAAAGSAVQPGPEVALSADGADARAVWTDTGVRKSVVTARWAQGAWGAPATVSGTDNGTFGYAVAVAGGARSWVVFSSQADGVYRVRAREWTAAGWGAPVPLSAAERQAELPDLATSADGLDGAAVWRESEPGAGVVRVATLRRGTWRPAVDVASAAPAAQPILALAGRGRSGWLSWAPREREVWSQAAASDPAVRIRRLLTPPDPPTGVVAAAGAAGVAVTWRPPADTGVPVDSYTATAAPGGARCSAAGSATGCTIPDLRGGRSYRITVVAGNAAGASEPAGPGADVGLVGSARAAQAVAAPPRRLKKGKRYPLAAITGQRIAVSWSARPTRICTVRRGKLVARRAGRCRLLAVAPATPSYLSLERRFTIKVWQPKKAKKSQKSKKSQPPRRR